MFGLKAICNQMYVASISTLRERQNKSVQVLPRWLKRLLF